MSDEPMHIPDSDRLRALVYDTQCSALSPLDREIMTTRLFDEMLDDTRTSGDLQVEIGKLKSQLEDAKLDRDEARIERDAVKVQLTMRDATLAQIRKLVEIKE